jgi:pyruvate dehydrogenase E2 component (dihydrolipoamide acetyltransferase)
MSKILEVKVPDLGGSHDVPVIEILVKDGDAIEKDAVLLVLESDKATMEVPAHSAGTVRGLAVKIGDKLSQGNLICQLEIAGETASAAPAPAAPAAAPPPAAPPVAAPAPAAAPATPVAASAPAAAVRVVVPDIGDFKNVPVIDVLVADGARVEKDAPLIVLESDKSTMEVPAPAAGTVRGLKVKTGDKLNPGDLICELESAGSGAAYAGAFSSAPPAQGVPSPLAGEAFGSSGTDIESVPIRPNAGEGGVAAKDSTPKQSLPPPRNSPGQGLTLSQSLLSESPPTVGGGSSSAVPAADAGHAGPATRKFARELGVDVALVKGSGQKGRVTIEDVQEIGRAHV